MPFLPALSHPRLFASQDPAAADLLARLACDPTDVSASTQDFHAAVQEYERLLGGRSFLQQQPPADAAAGAGTAGKSSSSKGRQASKRQKKAPAHEQEQQEQHEQDATAGVQVPAEVLPQVYRLYCAFLEQRMQALLQHEEHALSAAAVAQQLFKLLLAAHTAGAADEELYGTWVRLATQLQQHKVGHWRAQLLGVARGVLLGCCSCVVFSRVLVVWLLHVVCWRAQALALMSQIQA